jgi:hypothetical protein
VTFRLEPDLPPQAFKTYAIRRQPGAVTRKASCEEVRCVFWREGWETKIDTTTDLGKKQALYIVKHSGRRHQMYRRGDLMIFQFMRGQECFAGHTVTDERPPLFLVRDGDHRGNPTGQKRIHTRGEDWVEDMGEHLEVVREQREKG